MSKLHKLDHSSKVQYLSEILEKCAIGLSQKNSRKLE